LKAHDKTLFFFCKKNVFYVFYIYINKHKNIFVCYFIPIYSRMKKYIVFWIFILIGITGCAQTTPWQNLDNFAKCLTEKWFIMYGSETCPHCQNQKAMFGDSFQYINYVECTKEFEPCTNLKWVPTWEMSSGHYLEWSQKLINLATASTCTLD